MIKVGIIGCGHWGPNHIRVFEQLPDSQAFICVDTDASRLEAIRRSFPDIITKTDYREVLSSKEVDAVCVASPTNTHYEITKEALLAGKHVLCEKPLSLNVSQCSELALLATKVKKVLMVGHVFVFNAGIIKLKELIDSGELGKVQYAHAIRTNLGPFRYDVNALWDLAPHDLSIFNYLFDSCPVNVSARGQRYLGDKLEDVAFTTMEYPGRVIANVHVSWLDPKKVRQITIVGDKKMAVWDDLDSLGPVKIYDKHVERTSRYYESYGEFQLLSREGSITIPNIGFSEPLKVQDQYFIECLTSGCSPVKADALKGLDVVKTLVAIQQSMDQSGASVEIGGD
ncbi:MAG: Gfo/Idh/MocA family oxidoreductase [Candidatus Omnitrophota bacterium]